ncbi:Uncharacterised protein [Acetobacterium wieringae]|jgi:hypothetical protein|uniref:Uncharacterized protein n=1 Tax=Acetobacterium wieringae TaxID=52694 RepID=A0A1F2PHR3_9FIRM|nr:hypothetical protein ACWI_14440 [Acetobacterium wieringae]VUZ24906.1 Uncharacterised protein [Acetobacterium wieringae]
MEKYELEHVSAFAHLSLSVPQEGASNEWLEPVTDVVYDQL